jgi:FkbM family methyltransferase
MKLLRHPTCRAVLGGCLRRLFTVLPDRLAWRLLRHRRGWTQFLPRGRTVRFHSYLSDLTVEVNTDYAIEREMLSGLYDPFTLGIIERFVRPGDTCIDVGANAGPITLALARQVAPDGRVWAFEPGAGAFARLERNLQLNPALAAVTTAVRMGISDREGDLRWVEDRDNPGNAGCLGVTAGEPVAGTSIDAFFDSRNLGRLTFVKIDVEGMEYEVLKGGLRTWDRCRPVLLFETLPAFEALRGRPLFAPIETLLRAVGYRLYRLDPDGQIRPTQVPELSANTLAIPES